MEQPGGIIAVAGWLITSGLFAVYVANFGHYNKTYGSIAGVIIFLIWLWISNIAIFVVRMDSPFYGAATCHAIRRAGASFSVTARMDPAVRPQSPRWARTAVRRSATRARSGTTS